MGLKSFASIIVKVLVKLNPLLFIRNWSQGKGLYRTIETGDGQVVPYKINAEGKIEFYTDYDGKPLDLSTIILRKTWEELTFSEREELFHLIRDPNLRPFSPKVAEALLLVQQNQEQRASMVIKPITSTPSNKKTPISPTDWIVGLGLALAAAMLLFPPWRSFQVIPTSGVVWNSRYLGHSFVFSPPTPLEDLGYGVGVDWQQLLLQVLGLGFVFALAFIWARKLEK